MVDKLVEITLLLNDKFSAQMGKAQKSLDATVSAIGRVNKQLSKVNTSTEFGTRLHKAGMDSVGVMDKLARKTRRVNVATEQYSKTQHELNGMNKERAASIKKLVTQHKLAEKATQKKFASTKTGAQNAAMATQNLKKSSQQLAAAQKATPELAAAQQANTAAMKKAGMAQTSLQKEVNKTAKSLNLYESRAKQAQAATERMANKIRKFEANLLGAGLGLMFTGMAIKRLFQGIAQMGLSTFNEITGAQDAGAQSVARLSSAWTFLKFQIGSAIANSGLIPWIVGIINWFGILVSKHPQLVGAFVLIGLVVGTLMMVFGQFILGILATHKALQLFGMTKGIWQLFIWFGKFVAFLWTSAVGAITSVAGKFRMMGKAGHASGKSILGPFLAWVAILAIVLALGMSIGFMWKQIVKALKIRIEQLKLAFKFFILYMKFAFQSFKDLFILGWLGIQKAVVSIVKFMATKIADFLNPVIDTINSLIVAASKVPGAGKLLGALGLGNGISNINIGGAFDTSGIDAQMAEVMARMGVNGQQFLNEMFAMNNERKNLDAQLTMNRHDAGDALAAGWTSVIDWFKDKGQDVQDKLGFAGDDSALPAGIDTLQQNALSTSVEVNVDGGIDGIEDVEDLQGLIDSSIAASQDDLLEQLKGFQEQGA